MQDRCKFDASLMQAEETFTFTLDDETEKKLFELLTDVDVSKTPSFSIKDKYGNTAEYVKVVRCKSCDNYKHWECPVEQAGYRPMGEMYCAWAKRKTDPSDRSITCDHCKHWHGLKRGGIYWCSKHSMYMETGCEEGERKEE